MIIENASVNHHYWCVTSMKDGDPETMVGKWLSLDNHVHNRHTHTHTHRDKKFPMCVNEKLTGSENRKKMVQEA